MEKVTTRCLHCTMSLVLYKQKLSMPHLAPESFDVGFKFLAEIGLVGKVID